MGYIVKGNFTASLCRDFTEAVSNVKIRIYRFEDDAEDRNEINQDTKNPRILTKKEVSEKETFLIGKGKTDFEGNYQVELSDQYIEGQIAIDIKVIVMPGQKETKKKPLQFTVRKPRPIWRDGENSLEYIYNYRLSFEFWNHIRTLFDAWIICGYLKSSIEDRVPVVGATVSAFDVDWIKDDFLGSGVTDSKGYFRIDFSDSDFKQTFLSPAINIETPISAIPSPGVYFKVTTEDGSIIYEEDRVEGRTDERKHVPHCYGVDLYLSHTKNKAVK